MAEPLGPEWLAELVRVTAAEPVASPGLSARLDWTVGGAPGGDVKLHTVVEDGRLAEAGPGPVGGDAVLTVGYDDALAILEGRLDPSVAFMRGRLKVSGSMGPVLELLRVASSPVGRSLLEQLRAVADA
ncbi:MAG: SCP2 sterol-binding domain-containing protein [Acidimicrobiia bacterium]|nr:SCP2 sterol-binding domain-containing protein [Acidimicrobiia bacterium]